MKPFFSGLVPFYVGVKCRPTLCVVQLVLSFALNISVYVFKRFTICGHICVMAVMIINPEGPALPRLT